LQFLRYAGGSRCFNQIGDKDRIADRITIDRQTTGGSASIHLRASRMVARAAKPSESGDGSNIKRGQVELVDQPSRPGTGRIEQDDSNVHLAFPA
jgi:hypothetical protein